MIIISYVKVFEEYDWKIVSGIMFNHESEFRKKDFLIPKIISTAKQIKKNKLNEMVLGSLDLVRDWTYAEDVAIAIIKLFENLENIESSYVIGTGKGMSIKDIIKEVSLIEDIDLLKFVKIDKNFLRTNDPLIRISNPQKIKSLTFWEPKTSFNEMLSKTASGCTSSRSFFTDFLSNSSVFNNFILDLSKVLILPNLS